MSDFTTIREGAPSPTRSLSDYIAEGKNFWEACCHLRHAQRHGGETPNYREQIDSLKEFLSLIRLPKAEEQSPIVEKWIPSNLSRREERYYNYLLWQAFTRQRDRRTLSCPVIGEESLLEALYSGEDEFGQKHHIFNLLVARGFPERQACVLAKYIHLPNF